MHTHNFKESEWPFSFPINQMVVTTKYVMDGSRPLTTVLRDNEGQWLVLCDTTLDPDDGQLVCMGCLYTRFPFIGDFADLKVGWEAYREHDGADWEVYESEYE